MSGKEAEILGHLLTEAVVQIRCANRFSRLLYQKRTGLNDDEINDLFDQFYRQAKEQLADEVEKIIDDGFDPDDLIDKIFK